MKSSKIQEMAALFQFVESTSIKIIVIAKSKVVNASNLEALADLS